MLSPVSNLRNVYFLFPFESLIGDSIGVSPKDDESNELDSSLILYELSICLSVKSGWLFLLVIWLFGYLIV